MVPPFVDAAPREVTGGDQVILTVAVANQRILRVAVVSWAAAAAAVAAPVRVQERRSGSR